MLQLLKLWNIHTNEGHQGSTIVQGSTDTTANSTIGTIGSSIGHSFTQRLELDRAAYSHLYSSKLSWKESWQMPRKTVKELLALEERRLPISASLMTSMAGDKQELQNLVRVLDETATLYDMEMRA